MLFVEAYVPFMVLLYFRISQRGGRGPSFPWRGHHSGRTHWRRFWGRAGLSCSRGKHRIMVFTSCFPQPLWYDLGVTAISWWLLRPIQNDAKNLKRDWNPGYSSESTQRLLSNEYHCDRVYTFFKNLCVLCFGRKNSLSIGRVNPFKTGAPENTLTI